MTPLLVATRNRGKEAELRALLAPLGMDLVFPDAAGLPDSPEEATLECFQTFVENARAKADWFCRRSGLPTVADDSGVEVDALGGAPGIGSSGSGGSAGPSPVGRGVSGPVRSGSCELPGGREPLGSGRKPVPDSI